MKSRIAVALSCWLVALCGRGEQTNFVSRGANWSYFLGHTEASTPIDAWRQIGFDDTAWDVGRAPLGFLKTKYPDLGTELPYGPNNGYWTAYYRRPFVANNLSLITELTLSLTVDDGAVVWINGVEVVRKKAPSGELSHTADAKGSGLRQINNLFLNPAALLVPGTNVLAVHALNSSANSRDFYFDVQLKAEFDYSPPVVSLQLPPGGATVSVLSVIEVYFSKPVQGVNAADLLINGQPSPSLVALSPEHYLFEVPPQPQGPVRVEWAPNPGITDRGDVPQALAPGSWTYTLNATGSVGRVLITEFMASNGSGLEDEFGETSDWIEIFNDSEKSRNLGGWHLTDNQGNLLKWTFPEISVPPWGFLVVFASNTNIVASGQPLHANFSLSGSGEYLALVEPDGLTIASEYAPVYPPQWEDISYGLAMSGMQVLTNAPGFLARPTPGGPNPEHLNGFAPAVEFSRVSGTFTEAFQLTLSTTDPAAEIRCTLEGGEAGSAEFWYGGPLKISASTRVRARAFVPGRFPGPWRAESYLAVDAALADFESDLPLVVLHTVGTGNIVVKDQFVAVQTFEPIGGRTRLSSAPTETVRGRLRLRSLTAKQEMDLEVQDEDGNDLPASLLGMPADSDWELRPAVMYGLDFVRAPLLFGVARELGHYAPRTRLVELFLQVGPNALPISAGDYRGIYILTETPKITPNRVDIDLLDKKDVLPPAVTGGYHLNLSTPQASWDLQEPRLADLEPAQRDYFGGYMSEVFQSLRATNLLDPKTGYAAYFDVDSWIDHFIFQLVRGISPYRYYASYYPFFKPRNGKLTAGPMPWGVGGLGSFLIGYDGRFDPLPAFGLLSLEFPLDGFSGSPMLSDPEIWQCWSDRYQALREPGAPLDWTKVEASIDEMIGDVRGALLRDRSRWGYSLGNGVVSFPSGFQFDFGQEQDLDGEVRFMKEWCWLRLAYLDALLVPKPVCSPPGGPQLKGDAVTMEVPRGTQVYYALDGSDPRATGGAISASARLYEGPITLTANAHVVARAYQASAARPVTYNSKLTFSPWSGPVEAVYIITTPTLAIAEIMYHPIDPSLVNAFEDENYEFIELQNTGTEPLDLEGVRFTRGITFTFPPLVLEPSERVVVVQNPEAFADRYGDQVRVAGEYEGSLDNGGERLTLVGRLGETILDFAYNNSWYRTTDGFGFSLVRKEGEPMTGVPGDPANWRASSRVNGSPGEAEPVAPALLPILINEVLSHALPPYEDSVELFNPNEVPVDLGGWYLTDDFNTPKKFRFPAGTMIPAGAFVAFDEHAFNRAENNANGEGFSFDADGDQVYLFSGGTDGGLTGYVHGFKFDGALPGVSFGHYVTTTGQEEFVAQASLTLGRLNSGVRVGPVVVSEVMFHPPERGPDRGTTTFDDTTLEFIELHNLSEDPVPLYSNLGISTNGEPDRVGWRLKKEVNFTFPVDLVLPRNGFVLVTSFDPQRDPTRRQEFLEAYALPETTTLVGPYRSALGNARGTIELAHVIRVDLEQRTGSGNLVEVVMDRMSYSDDSPGGLVADGVGGSWQRRDLTGYGGDEGNWTAAAPTPADEWRADRVPIIVTQPQDQWVAKGSTASFQVVADGEEALRYQWLLNGRELIGATQSELLLPQVSPWQAGLVSVVVLGSGGWVQSRAAALDVYVAPEPPRILYQTHDQEVAIGSSARFHVFVEDPNQFTFQWRKDGIDSAGETGAFLQLDDVDIDDEGIYDAVIRGPGGMVVSSPARLSVVRLHFFSQTSSAVSVWPGAMITLSADAISSFPLTYQWRLDGVELPGETNRFLVIPNVQIDDLGVYDAVVSDPLDSIIRPPVTLSFRSLEFSVEPQSQEVFLGSRAEFFATGIGPFPIHYQWRKDGVDIAGATANELILPEVKESDLGYYSVVIHDGMNLLESRSAELWLAPLRIYQAPISGPVVYGQSVSLAVQAVSALPIQYQWFHDEVLLPNATNATLTIVQVRESDLGGYFVQVQDSRTTVLSGTADLWLMPLSILNYPASRSVYYGAPAHFQVAATNGSGLPIRYQWWKTGMLLTGATNASLTFSSAQLEDVADYEVEVISGDSVERSGTVSLTFRPLDITEPPQDTVVKAGETAMFQVTAQSATPLAYQWRRNGNLLDGATHSFLLIPNAQVSDEGKYDVVVTDSLGPVASKAARLNISGLPLSVIMPPLTQTVPVGGTAVFGVEVAGSLPLTYQWLQGQSLRYTETPNARQSFLTLFNVQPAQAGSYSVVITHGANFSLGSLVSEFSLIVVPDSDTDGIPDQYESAHGYNPLVAADALLDSDGDGMNTRQEYVAGTNPRIGGSYLLVDHLALTNNGATMAAVRFVALSNQTYTVQARAHLISAGGWRRVADVVAAATNRFLEVVDPVPVSNSNRQVYRLMTPRLP